MIKNFYDFELDLLIESLVLESKIEFSDKFLNILKGIKRNKIAKALLSLNSRGEDLDFPQNYIDTGKLKDEATFITNRKEKEILGKETQIKYKVTQNDRYLTRSSRNRAIYDRLGYTIPDGDPYSPPQGTIGVIKAEAVSDRSNNVYVWFIADDGNQTVLNKQALAPYDDRIPLLWKRNRNPIKIGRLVRSILTTAKLEFTEKDVEDFVNAYKSTFEVMENAFLKFKLVNGNDIAYWYNINRYADGGQSTLGNSCMAEVEEEYFEIYCRNTKVCSLLILFSDEGEVVDGQYKSKFIKGRALVWKTDQGDTFMDRIYTNHDSDVEIFKRYAFEKGWWCKDAQNSSRGFYTTDGTNKKKAEYTITLEKSKFKNYPYVDTFSLIDFEDKKMSNKYSLLNEVQGDLNDTDGWFNHENDYEAEW